MKVTHRQTDTHTEEDKAMAIGEIADLSKLTRDRSSVMLHYQL